MIAVFGKEWGAMKSFNKIGFLLVLLLSSFPVFAAKYYPVWVKGERLEFEIGYGFMTAGNALMRVVPQDTSRLLFVTTAWNNGFFESMYKVSDTIRSVVDKETLRPYFLRKINHEGGYHASTLISFDWLNKRASLSDTVFKEPGIVKRSTDTVVVLDGEYHNILSSLYKLRTMELIPGKSQNLLAVSGKKKYTLKVICHRRETVTVPAGTFTALVVEPVLQGDGIFQAKGSLTIWLTDDYRRIPVLMKSKIAVGSIKAELTGFKQGK